MFISRYEPEDVERYTKMKWWPGVTFADVFDKATDVYPDKEALVDEGSRFTYAQLRHLVDKLAIALIELGVEKGDRVLLQLPNWSEYVCCFFAVQKIGAVTVPLLPRSARPEITYFCRTAETRAWIVPEQYRGTNFLPVIDDVLKENPALAHVILVRGEKMGQFPTLEGLIERATLNKNTLQALMDRRPDPMEIASIGSTGGTTGAPKLVPRIHNGALCTIEYFTRAWQMSCNDVCLVVNPLVHGLSGILGAGGSFFSCAKLVLSDSSKPEDFCHMVEREKVTCALLVPSLASRLINFEGLRNFDLSSLAKLYLGGSLSSPELVKGIYDTIGCRVANAFGGAEGVFCMTRLTDGPDVVCYTVGRPACPYDRVKLIDENENERPPNMEGELAGKGPSVFGGYLNDEELNRKTFTRDGFVKTGDLAQIDDSGNVRITGRVKDIINRGGEKISAAQIEDLIKSYPDVRNVAVIGMPDDELGERICAYVELAAGAKLSFEDIVSFMKENGASKFLWPERVEFVTELPWTGVGKIDKKALREDIKRRLAST